MWFVFYLTFCGFYDYNINMFGFYDKYFLFFSLEITYYGFLIACAMGLGVFIACKNAKKRGLKSEDVLMLACYVLPLAILGARLYYVIFSDNSFSFWELFKIWDGGMAVYGGVIGGALGVGLYCLIHKKNFFDLGDIVVPSLILGQAIGRIGCYFSKCCYGFDVTGTNLAWFPLSAIMDDGHWHLSTFFYESIWNLMGFLVLMLLLRKSKIKQRGVITAGYFIIYGTGRTWIEALRADTGDSLYIGSMQVSQLVSILLIVLGVGLILFYYIKGRKIAVGKGAVLRDVSIDGNGEIESIKNVEKSKESEK